MPIDDFVEILIDEIDGKIRQSTLGFAQGGRIILGGGSGADGGAGVPFGVAGQLNQRLVTYDTTEAAKNTTSGVPSLVDNLNHIRYDIVTQSGRIDDINEILASGVVTDFITLSDTPNAYLGQKGKVPAVNQEETELEFVTVSGGLGGATYFTDLYDTPTTYSGYVGKVTAVNTAEDGLEFIDVSGGSADFIVCNGRLTAETNNPVPTSVASSSLIYFTPYKGNLIGLYDGASEWDVYEFSELSLSLSAIASAATLDIWIYNNSGTPALELTEWTAYNLRSVALAEQDGIYVKSGDSTRRYLGTIGTYLAGSCTDTPINRYVWNYYNRIMRYHEFSSERAAGDSHTYATSTWRMFRNFTSYRISMLVGVPEDLIMAWGQAIIRGGTSAYIGLGLNGVTPISNSTFLCSVTSNTNATVQREVAFTTAGRNWINLLEYSVGTSTFYDHWNTDSVIIKASVMGHMLG